MQSKRVTIQTVAEKAKVSIKTVSRVINKEEAVKASTRQRVKSIIEELGYKPSPAARALAGNTSKIIGLIYDNPSAAYVMDVQTGALKACYAEGYNLLIHPCDHTSENLADELVTLVQKSRLDGLILTSPLCEDSDLLDILIQKKIKLVNIGTFNQSGSLSSVSGNDNEVVKRITLDLIDKGHTEIGFVYGHIDHSSAHQRFIGYRDALYERNIQLNDELIVQGDFSFESGVSCGKQLLSLPNKPTAVFASNDYMAAGVLKVTRDLGLNIPKDLSIVGYDDAPVSRQIWPSLTTVRQPIQQMSEFAAALLIKKIVDPEKLNEHKVFDSELIFRESVKQLNS